VWNPDKKIWEIPISSVSDLCQSLKEGNIWNDNDIEKIKELVGQIIDHTKTDISEVTKNIILPLRPYQLDTVKFFKNRGSALGALDMALGKTAISIAYLYDLLTNKKVTKGLLVVPVSAIWHWYREIKHFFGDKIRVCVIGFEIDEDGNIKKVNREKRLEQLKSKEYDAYIINYEKLIDIVNNPDIFEHWNNTHKFIVIADEVTRVKSWSAQRTKAIKQIPATYRIGLSGRPIENNINEFYTILDWIWPRCLGSWTKFEKRFTITNRYGKIVSVKEKETIKDIARYIAIQYSRYEVLKYLPPINRNQYDVELSPEEEMEYKKIARKINDEIETLKYADNRHGIINVLALLQVSRMFSDHPVLVKNSKSDTAMSLKITTGKSAKMDEFRIILDEILKLNEKIVVFSQYRKMIDLLEADINVKYPMVKVYKYVGGGGSLQRQRIIDNFTSDQNPAVFLCTEAGAYAIELQCASYIINYDLPWNPAVLEQRISRLHRPGQKKSVTVINLVVNGPNKVESRILEILSEKDKLYKDIMGVDNESYDKLNNESENLVE
jgi:SNF2 family DNA or RNA helicase